jgi:hypothetical protein
MRSRNHSKQPKLRFRIALDSGRKQPRNKTLRAPAGQTARADLASRANPLEGEIVAPVPRVGRLHTVADWHRQVAKVYRAMRKGRMPKEDGTKLTYVANIGAQLAKYIEELTQFEERTRILEAILNERGQPLPAIEHEDGQEPTP